jgi:hypothetical protein
MAPAGGIFRTADLAAADWALAAAVASSVVLLDEARKPAARAFGGWATVKPQRLDRNRLLG